MVYNSGFLQPTLSPKQAYFYEWPKGVMSVLRRPDSRSQRFKSIFSPPRKSSPCSFLSSSKNSPSIFTLLFLTLIFSPLRERSKASPRISSILKVESISASHYWFLTSWSFSCRKRVLRLEINDPINHFH
ncbi:hypothetical protein AVEN_118612-1 [Araneus ventricosus]|uniref:Uncharacterized protein n=1 Tax=Araneus ventricosus TaxID=182803 RepID=A0A4Y2AWV4_ARAVE|nr:hypothetical protein AVEN_118612-1 [Araneus ventricosus]